MLSSDVWIRIDQNRWHLQGADGLPECGTRLDRPTVTSDNPCVTTKCSRCNRKWQTIRHIQQARLNAWHANKEPQP